MRRPVARIASLVAAVSVASLAPLRSPAAAQAPPVRAADAAQAPPVRAADATLEQLGRYVEQYYGRAQSVLADETVTLQPLQTDLSFNGFPRRLVYELRVEWNPAADPGVSPATVSRQLMSVGGRPPRAGDEPRCMDPRPVSPEPLAMLLPGRRDKFVFRSAGIGRVGGRAALMLDYAPRLPEPPRVEWRDECASVDLPGHTRGRVWVDPGSFEVLRLDERVSGWVDIPVPRDLQRRGGSAIMTIERAESSIFYSPVRFSDPDETLLLPARIDSFAVIRNSGIPRLRTTQTFSNYRRFLTASRVVQ